MSATDLVLVKLDVAKLALIEARTIQDVKKVIDIAKAMEVFAARQKLGKEVESHAHAIFIEAMRQVGEMLKETERRGPEHFTGGGSYGSEKVPLLDAPPTLTDLGISKKESALAQKIAELPEKTFAQLKEGSSAVLKAVSAEDKKRRRAEREVALGEKQGALPDKKYGVIVADPEWRFEPWSRETGMDRAADNHYPTSSTGEIAGRGLASLGLKAISIAADDCVLFLWATAPMIKAALEVMETWRFEYKSQFVWVKDKIGTGYWNRNKHEVLLVGTSGNVIAPAMGTQWPSAIEAPVGKHSAKPEKFLEMIEAYFPSLPKIELNRRGAPRAGWDAWGNEAA